MRLLIVIGLFAFASCNNQPNKTSVAFRRLIPDTTKTWAGQQTRVNYRQTRVIESKLGLETLVQGAKYGETRIWYLSGSYDPQMLLIAQKDMTGNWQLRTISFYRTKHDSIYADYTRPLRPGSVDSFDLGRYWSLPSQSDLKEGDSYGCLDGGEMFIEMADSARYRFMWYRCPDINKDKDSAFLLASELGRKLDGLAVEH